MASWHGIFHLCSLLLDVTLTEWETLRTYLTPEAFKVNYFSPGSWCQATCHGGHQCINKTTTTSSSSIVLGQFERKTWNYHLWRKSCYSPDSSNFPWLKTFRNYKLACDFHLRLEKTSQPVKTLTVKGVVRTCPAAEGWVIKSVSKRFMFNND